MLFVDVKYCTILCGRFRNYRQKDKYLFNFSCPICGDSEKNKRKARAYVYRRGSKLLYRCHNCSAGMSFGNFLKIQDSQMYGEYVLERFKDDNSTKKKRPTFKKREITFQKTQDTHLQSIRSLADDHYSKKYILRREIPNKFHNLLFYSENFGEWVSKTFKNYPDVPCDSRIVIPYYDMEGNIIGAQGRALMDTEIRYVTIKADEDVPLVYGLERWDQLQRTYVVEGPLDSFFIPNCIAATNSDLSGAVRKLMEWTGVVADDIVFVFDNERRSKQITKEMRKAIDDGQKICIWPENIVEKDLNDMIINGVHCQEIIDQNTYEGLEAAFRLEKWKRC